MKKISFNRGRTQVGRGDLIMLLDRFGVDNLERLAELAGFQRVESEDYVLIEAAKGAGKENIIYSTVPNNSTPIEPGVEPPNYIEVLSDEKIDQHGENFESTPTVNK